MHLARQHALTSHPPAPVFLHAGFHSSPTSQSASNPNPDLFTCATPTGFLVAHTSPLLELTRRQFVGKAQEGGLALALPLQHASLLLLVGGGRVPRFAPNKLVLWDEAATVAAAPTGAAAQAMAGGSSIPGSRVLGSRGAARSSSSSSSSSGSSLSSEASASEVGSIQDGNDSLDEDEEENDSNKDVAGASSTSSGDSASDSGDSDGAGFGARSMYVSAMYESAASSARPTPPAALASAAAANVPAGAPAKRGNRKAAPAAQPQVTERQPASAAEAPPPKPIAERAAQRGAAVAELEFSEGVTGVETYAFQVGPSASSGEESAGNQKQQIAYIVVVVLRTKAMVFELGSADQLHQEQQAQNPLVGGEKGKEKQKEVDGQGGGPSKQVGWAIVHRTTVDIAGNARQGLAAIAPASQSPLRSTDAKRSRRSRPPTALIALSGRQKGHVQLLSVPLLSGSTARHKSEVKSSEGATQHSVPIGASTIIIAHSSALNSITLSRCGRLLITSSDRGTLIRLWSVTGDPIAFGTEESPGSEHDGPPPAASKASSASASATSLTPALVRELRRGSDQAYILSVAIAPDLSALAVASDKGTVHIFRLTSAAMPTVSKPKEPTPSSIHSRDPSSKSSSSFPMPKAFKKATSLTRKHLLPTATSSLSMLPSLPGSSQLKKYLASEWATAHFRIPLRTFGGRSAEGNWGERGGPGGVESPQVRVVMKKANPNAQSKHGASAVAGQVDPAADDEDDDGFGAEADDALASSRTRTRTRTRTAERAPIEAIAGGSARSTEGGWAAMRARIEDVRRGEAQLDEKIFLTWTRARMGPRGPSSSAPAPASASARYELIALTTGGSWYRVGLDVAPSLSVGGGGGGGGGGSAGEHSARTDENSDGGGTHTPRASADLSRANAGSGLGSGVYATGRSHESQQQQRGKAQLRQTGGSSGGTRVAAGGLDDVEEDEDPLLSGGGDAQRRRAEEDRELEKSGVIQGCVLLEFRRFGQRD
ncbi:Phosphatidylinositol 3,5-bisphosphate-binding protein [Tilletia horrida]|nr:Phosphatidylinositol 3,5-bisphosphate-binding protein [Tilletia horrida]